MAEARDPAARFLHLAGAVWGLVWLFALAVTLATTPEAVHYPVLSAFMLAIDAAALAMLWRASRGAVAFAAVAMSAGALVNAGNVIQSGGSAAQLLTTTWLNSATILVAFVTPGRRRSIRNVLLIVSLSVLVLAWNGAVHHTLAFAKLLVLLPAAYAAALGSVVTEAAAAVRAAAADAERETQSAAHRALTETAETEYRAELRKAGHLLHDTVINTLGAIRRGVGVAAVHSTQERCRANLQEVRHWLMGADDQALTSIGHLVDAITVDALLLELKVDLVCTISEAMTLGDAIGQSARRAVRELLMNVAKHSGTDHARVDLHAEDQRLIAAVTDSGRGWNGQAVRTHRGFARSVREPCESLGGKVEVRTEPGGGTQIRTSWPLCTMQPPEPDAALQEQAAEMRGASNLHRIGLNTARWMLAIGAFEAALFSDPQRPWGAAAALALVVSAVIMVRRMSAQTMPPLGTAALTVTIALIIALPNVGLGICDVAEPAAFGIDAAAGLVALLCMIGPRRSAPFLAVSATVMGLMTPLAFVSGDAASCAASIASVLPIELGTVAVATTFRRLLERLWRDAERTRSERIEAERATGLTRAREAARRGGLRAVLAAVEPLVEGIATGTLDPNRDDVRKRAGRAESALRSLLVLDERLGRLGDVLAGAVFAAYRRGLTVRVLSGEFVVDTSPSMCDSLRELVIGTISELPPDATLDLGLFRRGEHSVLTLVTSGALVDAGLAHQPCEGLLITVHHMETEALMEVSWPR